MVNFRKKILFFYLVILPSVYIVMGFKLTTSSAEFSSCNHYTYLRLILFVNAVWTVLLTNNFQSVVVIPVGRAVASNSRGPRFKSSHWQNLYWTFYCQLYWKDENKEKEAGYGPLKKQFPVNISLEFLNYCCAFVRLGTQLKDYFHFQKRSLEQQQWQKPEKLYLSKKDFLSWFDFLCRLVHSFHARWLFLTTNWRWTNRTGKKIWKFPIDLKSSFWQFIIEVMQYISNMYS